MAAGRSILKYYVEYIKTKSLINGLLNRKLHIKNHLPK